MKAIGILAAAAIIAVLAISQLGGFGGGGTAQGAKELADEGSAIASLRAIHAAQAQAQMRGGAYLGSLAALAQAGALLDPVVASGKKAGYVFEIREAGEDGYLAVAVPEVVGKTGERGFAIDESGTIRVSADGSAPDRSSPPLGGS